MKRVSVLLHNSSIKVIEKQYSLWVPARPEQLLADVKTHLGKRGTAMPDETSHVRSHTLSPTPTMLLTALVVVCRRQRNPASGESHYGGSHPLGLSILRGLGSPGAQAVLRLRAPPRSDTRGSARRSPTLGPGSIHPNGPPRDSGFLPTVVAGFLRSNCHTLIRVRDSDRLVQRKALV
jgi:hypothetical protein